MDDDRWLQWWNVTGAPQLRAILLADWDPLEVGDAAQAQDEYDEYVGVLGERLREGVDPPIIAEYLVSCEQQFGFLTRSEQLTGVATRIADWYAASAPDG